MKNLRTIVLLFILAGVALLSYKVYEVERAKRILKEDLVELSKVKYGIFNVDEWSRLLEEIVTKKIVEFNFNELPKEEINRRVTVLLYKMANDLEVSFKEDKGFLPKMVASITGIFDKLEDQVPQFADSVMDFVEDPKNTESVRAFALNKLNELTDQTKSEVNYTPYDDIIEKYDCKPTDEIIADLNASIQHLEEEYKPYKLGLLALGFLAGLLLLFGKRLTNHDFLLFITICLCFLVTGLALPMIEIDARISEMTFSLLGEPIQFINQILYYKNKSILEVVEVMITQHKIDLIIVGFLVLLFSVLFPVAKLITSVAYVYWRRIRESGFIKFIIFKTGKWSMADVMVLAIFMAFIGFSGILREQLQQIEITSQTMDLLTTNESRLQVGFYAFLTFAVLSLLVSHKMQYSFMQDKKEVLEEEIQEVEEKQVKKRIATSKAKG